MTEIVAAPASIADYRVADLSLAEFGRREIELAEHEMPGLMYLRREYAQQQPLRGARITGSLHMTIQTAVLIETLVSLGAEVRWASCNVFSTQDHAAAAVVVGPDGTVAEPRGVPVFAWKGETIDEYWWCTERALTWPDGTPNMLLDDGGDATMLVHLGARAERAGSVAGVAADASEDERAIYELLERSLVEHPDRWTETAARIRGVTEETTTGVHRLYRMAQEGELLFPAINVNDSVTKSKFDNLYGCRHSLVDGINRAVDLMLGGKLCVVCGYGDVGKGCAASLRAQGARVVVTEIDPICALQALMEGYEVARLEDVISLADVVVTATGNCDVVTAAHLHRMKHHAVVGNIGHFDNEIDVAGLAKVPGIERVTVKPQVDEWVFPDGHSVIVLSEGRLLNLGNATGHPSFVMSTSFSNQVIAQIELFTRAGEYDLGVHVLPKHLDEKVARLHVDALGGRLTELRAEQSAYSGIPVEGRTSRTTTGIEVRTAGVFAGARRRPSLSRADGAELRASSDERPQPPGHTPPPRFRCRSAGRTHATHGETRPRCENLRRRGWLRRRSGCTAPRSRAARVAPTRRSRARAAPAGRGARRRGTSRGWSRASPSFRRPTRRRPSASCKRSGARPSESPRRGARRSRQAWPPPPSRPPAYAPERAAARTRGSSRPAPPAAP